MDCLIIRVNTKRQKDIHYVDDEPGFESYSPERVEEYEVYWTCDQAFLDLVGKYVRIGKFYTGRILIAIDDGPYKGNTYRYYEDGQINGWPSDVFKTKKS